MSKRSRVVVAISLILLPALILRGSPGISSPGPPITLTITGKTAGIYDPRRHRVYVQAQENGVIQTPRLQIRVTGLPGHQKIFILCRFIPGPYREVTMPGRSLFQISGGKGRILNMNTCQLTADSSGEARVDFVCTRYAGDRFVLMVQYAAESFAVGQNYANFSRRLEKNARAIAVFDLWKRMVIEDLHILKGVRFPGDGVMNLVRENLARLHIDCEISLARGRIDPALPSLSPFFSAAGLGTDSSGSRRYGPRLGADMDFLLESLHRMYSDRKAHTLKIIIFGFISPELDLLKEGAFFGYDRVISRRQLETRELNFNFQALYLDQEQGRAPVIFCWSDFFYLLSRWWRVPHDQLLARVLLHEIGHFLMRHSRFREKELHCFDPHGHLLESVTGNRTFMMQGISPLRGREKVFLRDMQWHPVTQRIIRRSFILSDGDGR